MYAGVRGWESFDPWLPQIETMNEDVVWGVVNEIPPEWYESQADELEKLARTLIERRQKVRELIAAFRGSSRNPFPDLKFILNRCGPSLRTSF